MVEARSDKAVWNAWYPVGSPIDFRRQRRTRTRLLDHELEISVQQTCISVSCEGRPLPVFERLGYVWTSLGDPEGMPPSLIEYYEVDRMGMNIWSTPIQCSGLRIVDNVIDNAHFPFVHPGVLGDTDRLDLADYKNEVDEHGALWSLSHRAWLPLINDVAEYTYWIPSPFTVILYIHRPLQPGDVRQRYDFLGVFAQPTSEESFIAHKMLAFVREDWMDERQLRSDQQQISVQDKYVLERSNPKKLPLNNSVERSVPVDSASIAYRDWLRDNDVRYGVVAG